MLAEVPFLRMQRFHAVAVLLVIVASVCISCSRIESSSSRAIATKIAGAYDWDPDEWHADEIWSGELEIDRTGCAYLNVTHRSGVELSEQDGLLLSFLRLPKMTMRHDRRDGSLRIGHSRPVSEGDHVTVLGSQGWRQESNQKGEEFNVFHRIRTGPDSGEVEECLAHVSFWVAWMGPSWAEIPSLPAERPPIAGMVHTDDAYPSRSISDWGVLEIEGRCPYLWIPDDRTRLDSRETPETAYVRDGIDIDGEIPKALRRTFIKLGQAEVHFDVDTQQLRMRGGAAMTTGDLVEVGGVLADGRYVGLDHYIEECHAPSVMAPSFMRACTPEPDYWPGFCEPSGVRAALEALDFGQFE
ncbi:MAG: hypothetical protein F4110_09635 [Acidimicrobiaceae bacterium]|nr:hypothetical protein [Acidimicrobiaceae bacterium]MYE95777.1 hypothetical protein [Acidimicrobiaceae bacterium]MYH43963.1 hypothetical protein [Acidimicrobiaceae bacterium]MYI54224.1 hypothetical protein [Acidimicrobiaceae bacterium]MYJ84901.1 hypothetical protein [Acidimicrobiaceae bacterium]